MNNVIELDNSNFKGLNFLYYNGKSKQDVLKSKSETIKKIPKENILGLGYTKNFIEVYDGKSMDDVTCGYDIFEYVIVCANRRAEFNLKTFETHSEKLLLCIPLCNIAFQDEKAEEEYKSNLDELGYIELPLNFKCLENNELIELFESNKGNILKK